MRAEIPDVVIFTRLLFNLLDMLLSNQDNNGEPTSRKRLTARNALKQPMTLEKVVLKFLHHYETYLTEIYKQMQSLPN